MGVVFLLIIYFLSFVRSSSNYLCVYNLMISDILIISRVLEYMIRNYYNSISITLLSRVIHIIKLFFLKRYLSIRILLYEIRLFIFIIRWKIFDTSYGYFFNSIAAIGNKIFTEETRCSLTKVAKFAQIS